MGLLQAVVVTDPAIVAEALGKDHNLEIEKSVDSVYSKFNIVGPVWQTGMLATHGYIRNAACRYQW